MRTALIVLIACLLVTGTAFAQKPTEIEGPKGPDRTDCLIDAYDPYLGGTGGIVPDADILGVGVGPLAPAASSPIAVGILYRKPQRLVRVRRHCGVHRGHLPDRVRPGLLRP